MDLAEKSFRFKIDQHAEWLFLHSVRIGFAKKCVINLLGFRWAAKPQIETPIHTDQN
jgi:hypothetical protein